VTLDKKKLNERQYGELLYLSSDTGQDKTERQSVWRITISVLTLDKIKLNDNQYQELLTLEKNCRSVWRITILVLTLDEIKKSGNQYGGLLVLDWDKVKVSTKYKVKLAGYWPSSILHVYELRQVQNLLTTHAK